MSDTDKKAADVVELDRNTLVAELTLGQLMEVMTYETSRKKIDAIQAEQKKALDQYTDFNREMYKDAKVLLGTSPFYLKTEADLEKFIETSKSALGMGRTLVLVMGICENA